jgi:hypothetical protein
LRIRSRSSGAGRIADDVDPAFPIRISHLHDRAFKANLARELREGLMNAFGCAEMAV